MEGFHVNDGLFFKRLDNGNVLVTKSKTAQDGSEKVWEHTIEKDIWASTIASVSKLGEQFGRFYLAEKFHNGDEKGEGY